MVNRPTSRGSWFALATSASVAACSSGQIDEAALLDLELEAAGAAEALDRRGAEDGDRGLVDLVGEQLPQRLRR